MKVLIVGAGIAGAAAALFLHHAGIRSEILELRSADSQNTAGQFLGLAPNGVGVMEALGLGSRLRATSLPMPAMQFVNSSGRPLGMVSFGNGRHSGVTIQRAALQRILRDEVQRHGIATHYERKLVELELGIGDARARFADGSHATADLLVGADGIHSRVRQVLFPAARAPAPTGLASCGGFAYCQGLAATPQGMQMVFGRRAAFGYVVSTEHEVYWFSTLDSTALARHDILDIDGWRRLLQQVHSDDGPVVNEILQAPWSGIGQTGIHDIATLPKWSRGHAILIGDAAHATAPHGGQGASLALEDGAWLAHCLREIHGSADIEPALQRFQQRRQSRVERIVAWSRRNGAHNAPKSDAARWLRDQLMPLALRVFARPESTAWIYDHEVPKAIGA